MKLRNILKWWNFIKIIEIIVSIRQCEPTSLTYGIEFRSFHFSMWRKKRRSTCVSFSLSIHLLFLLSAFCLLPSSWTSTRIVLIYNNLIICVICIDFDWTNRNCYSKKISIIGSFCVCFIDSVCLLDIFMSNLCLTMSE